MQSIHHTLKQDLTRTILYWSGGFFLLLGLVFLLSFNRLESYVLDLMADHRLSYQAEEFAKHLDQQDQRSIREESNALVQEQMITAILMVDSSGELMHVSLGEHHPPQLHVEQAVDMTSIDAQVISHANLHLYERMIPGHQVKLVLVLDDRPLSVVIYSASAWAMVLMLLLVLLSIKALHYTLNRKLIAPVEQLRQAVEQDHVDEARLHQLEDSLPGEAADILDAFDDLKHKTDEVQFQLITMMEALPACFWWSHDGKTYAGISEKCGEILHHAKVELKGSGLWAWAGNSVQLSGHRQQLQQAITQRQTRLDLAYQVSTAAGERWYGEALTLCYDADGQLRTVYGTISDITTRKIRQHEQAEQLELIQRMETTATLVGGIAHEFNNALAGMNGNVFLIKQSTTDEQTLNRIDRIEQLIERSAGMIDSMLSFARKSIMHPVAINMVDFLRNFQQTTLPVLPNRAQFDLMIDESLQADDAQTVVIRADKKKLHEVLMQLLQNASLAVVQVSMPRISISMGVLEANEVFLRKHPHISSSHLVHLQVQDNGCGIAGDIRSRIFDPFFTTREVGTGTGLGLSMAYGYIHQLGGVIDVESSMGGGSNFHIYLPRSAEPQTNRLKDTLLRGQGEKILLVDDDQVFRESTAEVLSRMGYEAIEAQSGKEAISLFEQHRGEIRLILMDILMPGMTGIQASRRIRSISADIPIVFLTAYDRTQPLEAEVYEQYAEVIFKPFRISILSQAIQKALRRRPDSV